MSRLGENVIAQNPALMTTKRHMIAHVPFLHFTAFWSYVEILLQQ